MSAGLAEALAGLSGALRGSVQGYSIFDAMRRAQTEDEMRKKQMALEDARLGLDRDKLSFDRAKEGYVPDSFTMAPAVSDAAVQNALPTSLTDKSEHPLISGPDTQQFVSTPGHYDPSQSYAFRTFMAEQGQRQKDEATRLGTEQTNALARLTKEHELRVDEETTRLGNEKTLAKYRFDMEHPADPDSPEGLQRGMTATRQEVTEKQRALDDELHAPHPDKGVISRLRGDLQSLQESLGNYGRAIRGDSTAAQALKNARDHRAQPGSGDNQKPDFFRTNSLFTGANPMGDVLRSAQTAPPSTLGDRTSQATAGPSGHPSSAANPGGAGGMPTGARSGASGAPSANAPEGFDDSSITDDELRAAMAAGAKTGAEALAFVMQQRQQAKPNPRLGGRPNPAARGSRTTWGMRNPRHGSTDIRQEP